MEEIKKSTIRFPAELKKKLKLIAVQEDTTLNSLVINALEWFVEEYEKGNVPDKVFIRRKFPDAPHTH